MILQLTQILKLIFHYQREDTSATAEENFLGTSHPSSLLCWPSGCLGTVHRAALEAMDVCGYGKAHDTEHYTPENMTLENPSFVWADAWVSSITNTVLQWIAETCEEVYGHIREMTTDEPHVYMGILLLMAQSPSPIFTDCQAAQDREDFPTLLKRYSPRPGSKAPAKSRTKIIATLGLKKEVADRSAHRKNSGKVICCQRLYSY